MTLDEFKHEFPDAIIEISHRRMTAFVPVIRDTAIEIRSSAFGWWVRILSPPGRTMSLEEAEDLKVTLGRLIEAARKMTEKKFSKDVDPVPES